MLKRKFHTSLVFYAKATFQWWKNEKCLTYFEKFSLSREQLLESKSSLKNFYCIQQNLEFLHEAGVPIDVDNLLRFRSIVTTDIRTLHEDGLIPDLNITERYLKLLPAFVYKPDLPMPSYSGIGETQKRKIQYHRRVFSQKTANVFPENIEQETAKTLLTEQRRVLRQFFGHYFSTDIFIIDQLMHRYMEDAKPRSIGCFLANLDIFENHFEFPRKLILRNFYLMNIVAERVQEIIKNVEKIGPFDLKTAAHITPKLLAKTSDQILDMEKAFKEYNINASTPFRVHVLSLTESTLRSRLKKISESGMKVFLNHPRICELIVYFKKASRRLEEIEQRGMRCISLHILTGNQQQFERYLSEGVDRTRCCQDILFYLSHILGFDRKIVYKILKKQPLRFYVPLVDVIDTTTALLEHGIAKEVILESVTIVLYPRDSVLKVLEKINQEEELKNLGFCNGFVDAKPTFRSGSLFKDRRVILCLYYLEIPFHFTGDGAMRLSNKQSILEENVLSS